jgi:hypothetical protein
VQTLAPERVIRVVERVEVPVVSPEALMRLEEMVARWIATGQELLSTAQAMQSALARVHSASLSQEKNQEVISAPRPIQPKAPTESKTPSRNPPVAEGLSQPQQRILDALAQFEALGLERVARSNVAVFADQSPRSSGFANNLSRLNTRGLIGYGGNGSVSLTEAGRAMAKAPGSLRTLEDLRAAWCARLSGPQARILQHLIAHYPAPLERTAVAEATGQSATSSGFANNLSALRSLKLLDYPQAGHIAATPLLFPPGLARNGASKPRRKTDA